MRCVSRTSASHGYEQSPRHCCLSTDAGAGRAPITRRRTLAARPTRACPAYHTRRSLPWGCSTLLALASGFRTSSQAGVCRRSSETPARRVRASARERRRAPRGWARDAMMCGVPVLGAGSTRASATRSSSCPGATRSVVRPPLRAGGDAIAGAGPARRAGRDTHEFDIGPVCDARVLQRLQKASRIFLRGHRLRLRVMGIL